MIHSAVWTSLSITRENQIPHQSSIPLSKEEEAHILLRAFNAHMMSTKTPDADGKYGADTVLAHVLTVGVDRQSLFEGMGESCGATQHYYCKRIQHQLTAHQ